METEVRSLKQDLAKAREALKAATKRCRDLVRELDNRTACHDTERTLRDQQLSRILRALLALEGRLKQEQKSIRQLLCEKDNVIRNQQLEIAKLRRYTKNYIRCKREHNAGVQGICKCDGAASENPSADLPGIPGESDVSRADGSLSKDIQNLKCEIITKLNEDSDQDHSGIRKTHSFAESDISKTSMTSSENTDVSIITTTTTDSSPSLLSTEGFCEGESTDVSPGSTLNKSNRCTPTTVTDEFMSSDNETALDDRPELPKRRFGVIRSKPLKLSGREKDPDSKSPVGLVTRTDSKDDGMDCNFVSDEEPIYENTQCEEENNERNLKDVKASEEQQTPEETSGNWYSDPDEDRISDDVFRNCSYRPNSNHNSVLECVNQILLRDMEEEDNVLSVPRRFKHRGRIVHFQPARLSDIESVGSEMERRNSEENVPDKDCANSPESLEDVNVAGFEATASEDEFGMKIAPPRMTSEDDVLRGVDTRETCAIPIVIIEPRVERVEEQSKNGPIKGVNCKTVGQLANPPLKMERIEEKACLQMSAKGLTIAKNLDYEDIESLPDVVASSPAKTPPALPPKPPFKGNTLILKKIPSPSFLINESHKKPIIDGNAMDRDKRYYGYGAQAKSSMSSARSLTFDDKAKTENNNTDSNDIREGSLRKNKFDNVRSSFQSRQNANNNNNKVLDGLKKLPKVTNIVRHFEEFKIGESDNRSRERIKDKPRVEFDQDFDMRQNFEEFNLDDCDLSDDPDRPEADGSERLAGQIVASHNEKLKLTETEVNGGYDHFLEATGLSTKSILTPSRLLSNHKSMLKPKDVKYKNKIKATAVMEKHGLSATGATHTHVRHWTGPFV